MAIVDNRGRLFGRFNVIDAAVVIVLVGLIPLIYGAWVLFRRPQPAVESISPTRLGPHITRVQIKGRNLRPFLRISFNEHQGKTFAFIDENTADIDLPELPPGSYDVILYDVAREISRLPGAVAVEGPAMPATIEGQLLISGRFLALDEPTARDLQQGTALTATGSTLIEIVARAEPVPDRRTLLFGDHQIESRLTSGVQLRAVVRARCRVSDKRCQVGGVDVDVDQRLTLYNKNGTPLRFDVSDVVADAEGPLVDLRARFVAPAEAIGLVKIGDRARREPLFGDRVPTVMTVGQPRAATSSMQLPAPAGVTGPGEWSLQWTEGAASVDATIRVRAEATSGGLQYRGRALRAGAPFVFEHERYVLRGWIQSLVNVGGDARR